MNAFEFYATRVNRLHIALLTLSLFTLCYVIFSYVLADWQHNRFGALTVAALLTILPFGIFYILSVKKIKIELVESGRVFNLYLGKRLIYSNYMANFLYINANDVSGDKDIRRMKIHFTDKSFCFNLIRIREEKEKRRPNEIILSFIGRYRLKQERCANRRKSSAYTYNYCNPNKISA